MPTIILDTLDDPRVSDYHAIRDADLVRTRNLFVAEGRLVLERILHARRYCIRSILLSDAVHKALEATLRSVDGGVPIYVGRARDFRDLAGMNMHRGCLALVERPQAASVDEVARLARTVVLLDRIANPDNVGGIFRNAAAFCVDGVLLSRDCCDPFYRKSIRTSMGSTLSVPFAYWTDSWSVVAQALRALGFQIAALSPRTGVPVSAYQATTRPERLALLFGAESDGLHEAALAVADVHLRIPISRAVDSLNVAVAAGIALASLMPEP